MCNCKETAPDRVGDQASNRENLALRYELIPYLYSLAHLAHQNGEPVYPSLSYVYAEDSAAADRVNQKMIGQQLMSPVNAKLGGRNRLKLISLKVSGSIIALGNSLSVMRTLCLKCNFMVKTDTTNCRCLPLTAQSFQWRKKLHKVGQAVFLMTLV
ncbi:glycoside hydrolase family 31 protein [Vibrio sinaloensis]|nr:glycoside hydrolase family 31 protein [Vibrio sinaloensis]